MEDYLPLLLSFLGPSSTTLLSAAALHEAATDICVLCCLCLELLVGTIILLVTFFSKFQMTRMHSTKVGTNENHMLNLSDMFDGEELC